MTEQIIYQLNILGPDGERRFIIPEGQVVIGRQAGVDLRLDHGHVSRRHAILSLVDGSVTITDLGSANGTQVNGQNLMPEVPLTLKPEDTIQIAVFVLIFEAQAIRQDEPLPEMVPESEPSPQTALEENLLVDRQSEVIDETMQVQDLLFIQSSELPPTSPPPPVDLSAPDHGYMPPPGQSLRESRYLAYLPDIYHTDFMGRFLALFESIFAPVQWTAENFDLFLSPRTAPHDFLPWLADWYEITFDNSWPENRKRMLLAEAHQIYARRGTKWALSRVLEIYLGQKPVIKDQETDGLAPFTFVVELPQKKQAANPTLIEQIIDYHKPAYTNYQLVFAG